jgi:CubicO group peptidase (beta-lactamase class C family)
VALVSRDEVLWAAGIGLADVAAGMPATADTLFRVGSISKSFVSLSVLMLQEEARLDLNDRLRDLAPEIEFTNPWEETDPVRLVHLLEHTAGFDDVHLREYAHNDPTPISLRDGLLYNPRSRTCRWRPGIHYSYCNSGPAVAAYVVQRITGRSFEAFVRESIFEPLGMATATYLPVAGLAKGYLSQAGTEAPYWHILLRPAGALNVSPREMARFVQLLLNRGSFAGAKLVEPTAIERMETPTTTLAARQGLVAGSGLGSFSSSHEGFLFHGHAGSINSHRAEYGYLPEQGLGYAFMINTPRADAAQRLQGLLRSYLTHALERPQAATVKVPAERLAAWAGYYEPITPRQEMVRFLIRLFGIVRVEPRRGGLAVRPLLGEEQVLVAASDRSFRARHEPVATVMFLEGDDHGVLLQDFGSAVEGSYRAISGGRVWLQWTLAVAVVALMLSSGLYALNWVPRKLFGRMPESTYLRVRTVPLLAVLALATAVVLLMASQRDFIRAFGNTTVRSVAVYLLTWLFTMLSVSGLLVAVPAFWWPVRRGVVIHSLLVSVANVAMTLYLGYWGIIGLRTWNY